MDGRFQGMLNCSTQYGGCHMSNGALTSTSRSQPTSSRKLNSNISNTVLKDSNRRASQPSPPVPPRKNPPPPPPPREGHPRWHSMKENNFNSINNGGNTIRTSNVTSRRASDSKAFISRTQTTAHSQPPARTYTSMTSSPNKHQKIASSRKDSRPSDLGSSEKGSLDVMASSELVTRGSIDMDSGFGEFIPLSPEYKQSKFHLIRTETIMDNHACNHVYSSYRSTSVPYLTRSLGSKGGNHFISDILC